MSGTAKPSAPVVSLKVNGVQHKFLVDSGASVNVINHEAADKFTNKLMPSDARVYAFNSSEPLPVVGTFTAVMESKCGTTEADFLVVSGQACSLLGYTIACDLGILQIANAVSIERNIFQMYPSLFHRLGKMRNVEVKLHIDEKVEPIRQSHRGIPFHQRKNLEASVESLLQPVRLPGYHLLF